MTFTVCCGAINGNVATNGYGGGIYTNSGNNTLNGVEIKYNNTQKGGGVYILGGFDAFTNCTIDANVASVLGVGICYKSPGNYSMTGGSGVVTPDP
jgi:hypothetical protein